MLGRFDNLPFSQLVILSIAILSTCHSCPNCHFVNLKCCLLIIWWLVSWSNAILSTSHSCPNCHFVNLSVGQIPFCQLILFSKLSFVGFKCCLSNIWSTCQLLNLPCSQLIISLTTCHLVYLLFFQLAILFTSFFVNFSFTHSASL